MYQMRYERLSARSVAKRNATHAPAETLAQLCVSVAGAAQATYGTAPKSIVMPVTNSGEWRSISRLAPTVYTAQQSTEKISRKSPLSVVWPNDDPSPTTT